VNEPLRVAEQSLWLTVASFTYGQTMGQVVGLCEGSRTSHLGKNKVVGIVVVGVKVATKEVALRRWDGHGAIADD
jgi:uncharacterized membrane protein YidH (DUF202 family)